MSRNVKDVKFSPGWMTNKYILYYRTGTGGRCCTGAGRSCVHTHQAAAPFRVMDHLEIMISYQISDFVNRCVFT